jgi:hypothetical protein
MGFSTGTKPMIAFVTTCSVEEHVTSLERHLHRRKSIVQLVDLMIYHGRPVIVVETISGWRMDCIELESHP